MRPTQAPAERWKLHPRIQLEPGTDSQQGTLIDTYTAEMSNCNDTAWRLLQALATGADQDTLVGILHAEFEVDADAASHDVMHFLQHLRSESWLARVSHQMDESSLVL